MSQSTHCVGTAAAVGGKASAVLNRGLKEIMSVFTPKAEERIQILK